MAAKQSKRPKSEPQPQPAAIPSTTPFGRFCDWVFRQPYNGVPWVVAAYALLCCLIYTGQGPFTGHVIGFDDQVRMTQVLNLVNGAGWYDRTIMRANPPEGFDTIWSRIVDLPLSAVVIMAQLFTDQRTAALVAVVVIPMVSLIILFYVARYFARPLVGKRKAWLIVLFLMFTTILNQKRYTLAGFHLGQASHHSWYIILNLLMFGATARVAANVRGKSPIMMTGLAIALLLAVGIEGYPMIAGDAAILAIIAWAFNDVALARRGAMAIGAGALLSLILLPMHVPPAHLLTVSFSQPSILGPILVGAATLFLLLETFVLRWISKRSKILSAMILTGIAAIIGYALVSTFPQIMDGPAAALSPNERKLAFSEHPEAWSMLRVAVDLTEYIGLVMPTLIALIAGIYALRTTTSRRRRILYASYFGFTALGTVMSQMFWRYYHHALTASCGWLLWGWNKIGEGLPKNNYHALAMLGVFILLAPLWMLLLPAVQFNVPVMSQVLLYPAKIYSVQNSWDSCDVLPFADYLNKTYDKKTLIEVPDWDSASFLYNTDLRIDFLSNYPSHDKFIDNKVFFQTQDVDVARDIAKRHGFDLVAICLIIPMSQDVAQSRPYREPVMIERLKEGIPPAWLKPVETPGSGLYRLYAVDKKALAGAGGH